MGTATAAQRLVERTGAKAGDPARVAERLSAAIAEVGTRWPELRPSAVLDVAFVDALVTRIDREVDGDLDDALARLALPDLYLVASCLHGERGAIAAVERLVRAETERAVARLGGTLAAEDLAQELLVKLVVGPSPKLSAYGGHGALHAWLRVAAVRTAISLGRRTREAGADDAALEALADDHDDQALAFLKASYRAEFKLAFAAAFAELPGRSRTILRLQILDHLTFEEIAAFYQVSRATAARWLAAARVGLVEQTQARLARTLAIGTAEMGELMRMVASNLYSTLPGLLQRTGSRES